MTRTQRRQMINDHIADRIRATAYTAWYQMHMKATDKGTIYTKLKIK